MFEKVVDFVKTRVGLVFGCILFLGIALHCLTLSYSPLPWIDEVQIQEIAHGGVGEKTSSWNMTLVHDDGQLDEQAWAMYYLGGYLSEQMYTLFGRSGGRALNLLLLTISTSLLVFYCRKKTGQAFLSYLVGLLYFTFPPLLQSLRGGRVDVLALTCLISALALLQIDCKSRNKLYLYCALASGVAVLAVFSWATAILCAPIILWEVLDVFKEHKLTLKQQLLGLSMMVGSGLFTAGVVLMPFLCHYQVTIETFLYILSLNSSVSSGGPYVKETIGFLCAIPGVYLVGLLALFLKKRFLLLALSAATICFIAMMTHCYVFRFLYLLPYALIGIAVGGMNIQNRKLKVGYLFLLFVMGCISFGYSVLLRNGTEFFAKDVRNVQRVKEVIQTEIGCAVRIYCDTFQLYYIGRELNWSQYRLAGDQTAIGKILEVLPINFYITEQEALSQETLDVLTKNGFVFFKKIVVFDLEKLSAIEKFLLKFDRLRPYGPYYLYSKVDEDVRSDSLNE